MHVPPDPRIPHSTVVLSLAFRGILPGHCSAQAKCSAHDSQLRCVLCDIYIVISDLLSSGIRSSPLPREIRSVRHGGNGSDSGNDCGGPIIVRLMALATARQQSAFPSPFPPFGSWWPRREKNAERLTRTCYIGREDAVRLVFRPAERRNLGEMVAGQTRSP